MKDPPYGKQRRPGKVVCDDGALGADLFRCLASLKVECSQLDAVAANTAAHAAAVAKILVRAGGASPGIGGSAGSSGGGGDGSDDGTAEYSEGGAGEFGELLDESGEVVWRGLFSAAEALLSGSRDPAVTPAAHAKRNSPPPVAVAAAAVAAVSGGGGGGGSDDDDDGDDDDEGFHSAEDGPEEEAEEMGSRSPPWLSFGSRGLTARHLVVKVGGQLRWGAPVSFGARMR